MQQNDKNIESVCASEEYIYEDFKYTISNEKVTIMSYLGTEKNISIPDFIDGKQVDKINSYAFKNSSFLEEIILPNCLTQLGVGFISNTSIKKITIPKSIKSCGYSGLAGPLSDCESLEEVEFEDGLEAIPNNICATSGNSNSVNNIKRVIIPDSVKRIGSDAFYDCKSLESIQLPPNLEEIGSWAFGSCINLLSIIIPQSVKSIGAYAFSNCESFSRIDLPESLSYLGNGFIRNTSINKITIPKSIKSCGYSGSAGSLSDCESLEEVEFEDGLEAIPNNICATSGNSNSVNNIKRVIIPDSVKRIGNYAFYDCKSLYSIDLPPNVSVIGTYAFEKCNEIKIFSPRLSITSITLINNKNNFGFNNNTYEKSANYIEKNNSHFTITSSANLSVRCSYNIKEKVFEEAINTSVKIYIPDGAEIVDRTLYLDKNLCTNYSVKDTYLSVPVSSKSGKISFQLDIAEDCKLQTYAILNYTLDGKTDSRVRNAFTI